MLLLKQLKYFVSIVENGNFTEADFLIDGGATASYYYGKLRPENQ